LIPVLAGLSWRRLDRAAFHLRHCFESGKRQVTHPGAGKEIELTGLIQSAISDGIDGLAQDLR
jgi:hypothetical protein